MDKLYTIHDIQTAAKQKINSDTLSFIEGGAHHEQTLKSNVAAFNKYAIRPRVMRDVSKRDMSTTILGQKCAFPVGVAPTSTHKLVNIHGEVSTAKSAVALQTVMTNSMMSSVSIKDIMAECPSLLYFQQVYVTKPRDMTENIVHSAVENNVKAIVVTVDHTVYPIRLKELQNNMDLSERLAKLSSLSKEECTNNSGPSLKKIICHGSATWDDISWLKSITKLPIVAKGIMTGDDANEALKHGIDAIWVSNHGGRTLDCVPATIDVLSEVVRAVNGRCEVYIDGGFRTGLDVFKALAMGARAVFLGRPISYGLSIAGEDGANKVMNIIKDELDNVMALAGCKDVDTITNDHVINYCCRL